MVHYRTANQQTARNTKKIYQLQKAQTRPSRGDTMADLQQTKIGRAFLYVVFGAFALFMLAVVVLIVASAV